MYLPYWAYWIAAPLLFVASVIGAVRTDKPYGMGIGLLIAAVFVGLGFLKRVYDRNMDQG